MATRIRTLDFLPEIFKTNTNAQFLAATLDQLVAQPNTRKIQGYIGSKFGYGVNANDYYVTEPTKARTDYQLDPGVIFLKENTSTAKDFISYPGIIDSLTLEGGITNNNNRLFNSQFYSWDSFTNLDPIINYNQYYWIPEGPERVNISTNVVYNADNYNVQAASDFYLISSDTNPTPTANPTLTLLRGGTYTFNVNQTTQFWIQGAPGVTGYSPTEPNVQTRNVYGVTNNGETNGTVTFYVPQKNALDDFYFPGNNKVDVISTLPFAQVNGAFVKSIGGIDGITALDGLTVMFYNTGVYNEIGYVDQFYDQTLFDENGGVPYNQNVNYPGSAIFNNNFEGGYYSEVAANFYTIKLLGELDNPIIQLTATAAIPTEQKITATQGTEWVNKNFFRSAIGVITLEPYNSAILNTLYYQDGTIPGRVGVINLIDNNVTNQIDVLTDILGKKNYTAPNGVVFTNGLKVIFQGNIYPESYNNVEYYVEGVGNSIELIAVSTLISPGLFSEGSYIPYDTTPYDVGNYDSSLYVPVEPEYITIARNAINRNPWSRSNRWFHIDVITASATYNNNPALLTEYTQLQNKAKRPIIEFYPNLKLFKSGVVGKDPIDFIDTKTTDAFTYVAGQPSYYPDTAGYSSYDATIAPVIGPNTSITATKTLGLVNQVVLSSTTGLYVNDTITFGASFGGITLGTKYYILDILGNNITISTTKQGSQLTLTTTSTTSVATSIYHYSTTITIPTTSVFGLFETGQYITDSTQLLPSITFITAVNVSGSNTVLTVSWYDQSIIYGTSIASVVTADTPLDNYALFDGARVVFSADTDTNVKNKIYISRFSTITPNSTPVITLTEAEDGLVLPNEQTVVFRGYYYKGQDFYFTGENWYSGQQKTQLNQPPKFDVYDSNGISFGDKAVYVGTSFTGSTLFSYGIGTGGNDIVLGFPLRYSAVDNVGDISFDVTLNSDTFTYVDGVNSKTEKVNTGYVYNYEITSNTAPAVVRQLGWQTAVSPSAQYQIFEFDYNILNPINTFTCDIAPVLSITTKWPLIQVYINNVYLPNKYWSFTTTDTTTLIDIPTITATQTVVQVLILSDQVSATAYYQTPINLNNNPFNADLTTANIGEIRGQYQSIFYNNLDTTGEVFGPNNYRDLGNLVPWGNRIIQNSASLVMPGTILRNQSHNLFNSLLFNSRQYITFKTLLVDTINNTDYTTILTPAAMLDGALDKMNASHTDDQSFFWSDMIPSKAPYISNSYSFANSLDVSIYPLSRIYNYSTANYYGVLVYLIRNGVQTQLIKGVDYTISADTPSLTITLDLLPNDQITINEYNQTYGSYTPNTPTKLGLYPATIPAVVLDTAYNPETYFILGHDGSFNKLYGSYDPTTGVLVDFRDQVLLEYETRVYNNLKLSETVPAGSYEGVIIPGFFRQTDYTYDQFLQIYSESFLNWVGQNRIDYKTQFYNKTKQFSYNYRNSSNKLNNQAIAQGYFRGAYLYFYDTSTPNETPWEMLGLANEPTWWTTRYGAAPYTSDNLVLWEDLAEGIVWNNGNPYTKPNYARPGLLDIIPVNSNGDLLSPIDSIVGNYDDNTFQKDWQVGDVGPAEFSYRRSSTWPFDLMRILALTKPADFFNLGVDVDNYKYNVEFNQYLVNDRSHLVLNNIPVYGQGTPATSYLNWIVDYEKQVGVDATTNISTLLNNLDVRLVYRAAGFSDKNLLKFYVEKSSANSNNSSLLIPDESYGLILYENQPIDRIIYSGVVVQITENGFKVYGNSQTNAYFKILTPKLGTFSENITVENLTVKIYNEYYDNKIQVIPYGVEFYNAQQVSQFLMSYGAYLISQGVIYDVIENGLPIVWSQMVAEFLYWAQTGWEVGSITTLNPSASSLTIDKDSRIVQPLTLRQSNFVLNQDLYPIPSDQLSVIREGTRFSAIPLNSGDAISYGQFNVSNIENGIIFDNVTLFNDVIYNLTTGLRQNRITVNGTKTADWNGTLDAYGFIYNQDNVVEWTKEIKYTKGSIVKYKNKYWAAITIVQAKEIFDEREWKETPYTEIQRGLLPNSQTRSYESTLYYDADKANLENDADLLSFSLIGYRPRDYLALVDLTDITQVNVYKNLIKDKGTKNAASAFKGANLPQGGIDYELYENWAIKSGEFGGTLNNNFIEFRLKQPDLTGNPSIVGLTNGTYTNGVQQEVPLYSVFNYGTPITSPNILPTISSSQPSTLYPTAGYVNFDDVKMASYFYSGLFAAQNSAGTVVPISEFYVRDYVWLANYLSDWQVYTPASLGSVINAKNNLNGTVTITFSQAHNLTRYQVFAIVNFNVNIDNYYVVAAIVDPFNVIINLSLNAQITNVNGLGIGFRMQSQRVATAPEIINLPLLDNEFNKVKVWVDTNNDGSWAVYRKSLNYQYNKEIVYAGSQTFGSAVSYTDALGYLISDSAAGEVYRYSYDTTTDSYLPFQTITQTASFGANISYIDNLFVISQPTGSPKVYVYQHIATLALNTVALYQTITAPVGVTTWGTSTALSGDQNWLYISDIDNNSVYAYRRAAYTVTAGNFVSGNNYTITSVGTTDFTLIGASSNTIGTSFLASGAGTGTGTAANSTYEFSYIIDGDALGLTSAGDNFGYSISTDYYGDTVVVGTPQQDYDINTANYGYTYVFSRTVQNLESQSTSQAFIPIVFPLAWTPVTVTQTATATSASTDRITVGSSTGFSVGDPVVFSGTIISGGAISQDTVYYVQSKPTTTTFTISATRYGSVIQLSTDTGSMTVTVQTTPLYVTINGIPLADNYYAVIGSNLNVYSGASPTLNAGDILNVSGSNFVLSQTLTNEETPRVGVQFGLSTDTNKFANEILIGAPFELSANNYEGAVHRYTNGGERYGIIAGTTACNMTAPIVSAGSFRIGENYTIVSLGTTNNTQWNTIAGTTGITYIVGSTFTCANIGTGLGDGTASYLRTILLNGYRVKLPAGNAATVAASINLLAITNIFASATADGKLILSLINKDLGTAGNKLSLSVLDTATLGALGMNLYAQTQKVSCPHLQGRTQFGTVVKFDKSNSGSFVASAPVGVRYSATTFDFTDDELDNDTVFDNNATQWVDTFNNAGAVYMFDYLSTYNENLNAPGKFVYAQSTNAQDLDYGSQPYYGAALDFNNNRVTVGTPNFMPTSNANDINGQVVTYVSTSSTPDWSVFRNSAPVVDINGIFNIQLFSAMTNQTLENLDYIDPLQGKLLGAVVENIDIVSNADPARYTSTNNVNGGLVWGTDKVGQLWFDTSNVRFMNYHQNDVSYNSRWWGRVFPGSDVAVYSWVASDVPPSQYIGPGVPYSQSDYSIRGIINAEGLITPFYYFWARNTNIVFSGIAGKTLADSTLQTYIAFPQSTGISYFTPFLPNVFGLYNCFNFINANDTVLHVGYAITTNSDDVAHNQYSLIRANYADDFLSGVPGSGAGYQNHAAVGISEPIGLYNRMLDSMCGVDNAGGVVPDPLLPKAVQTGILARPRQGFFYNRFGALKNYLEYANVVLAQFPIIEIRNPQFLYQTGEFYDTTMYWNTINWWATGYNDNTKSALQVPLYADLSTLNVAVGTIVTVATNGAGNSETYIYAGAGVWTRIGLSNGTIQFSSYLWDYAEAKLGFGDNFFDTTPYDEYPSEETRYIIRALNEQIYTNELLIFRNKSLILLFEYIQSETIESQNYLDWLNKTSFMDVSHTIRELIPLEVFRSDNQLFLEGYLNEVKPYHVVIKEFIFKYTRTDVFEGDITDFDLPAQFNTEIQQFVTPELVYANPSGNDQYLATDAIWQTAPYSQWYNNYGLSITGQPGYQISVLASYMSLNSRSCFIDNVSGFPVTGTITIGEEKIGYANRNLATNELTGLSRGMDGTTIAVHIPGEYIFIDLPPVVVLNEGRGYANPPRVTAYIDTTIYPAPRVPAQFEPVMSLGYVVGVNLINPGEGYAVLPSINIDPAFTLSISSTNVNVVNNTFDLTGASALLQTGDMIVYSLASNSTSITGLIVGQRYYVNLLETTPSPIFALYTTYLDALNDHNRVVIASQGTGTQYFSVGAVASCVTSAIPVRENSISLRFDRTSYNSQVVNWVPGNYYGSFYAGSLNNSSQISSSAITLSSSSPPISSILASAHGAVFEILNSENQQTLTWSSRTRDTVQTYGSSYTTAAYRNAIRINPSTGGADVAGYIGSTTGFYIGMPVKFVGSGGNGTTITSSTPIGVIPQSETVYYVKSLVQLPNNDVTLAPDLLTNHNYVIASLGSTNWNNVAGTTGVTYSVGNVIIVKNSGTGTGTANLLQDTGFTISDSVDLNGNPGAVVPQNTATITAAGLTLYVGELTNLAVLTINYDGIRNVTSTAKTTNYITTPLNLTGQNGTNGFYIGLPVFFTGDVFGGVVENEIYYVIGIVDLQTFTISTNNSPTTITATATHASNNSITCSTTTSLYVNEPIMFNGTTFGGIVAGTIYYVREILSGTSFTIANAFNGNIVTLSDDTGSCSGISQADSVVLSSVSNKSMTLNVGLPVSPGQITGQEFTLYETSPIQYANKTGTVSNLLTREISATLANVDRICLTAGGAGLTNISNNLEFNLAANIGGLTVAGGPYTINGSGTTSITVTNTSSTGYWLTLPVASNPNTTSVLYVGMPLYFSGTSLGGVAIGEVYYVYSIDASPPASTGRFTISTDINLSSVYKVTTDNGTMTGTGDAYLTISGHTLKNSTQPASISNASPAVITVGDGSAFVDGASVIFHTTGTLPIPLNDFTTYYVTNLSGNTFNVSYTPTGTAINTTSAGTGTHTVEQNAVLLTQTTLSNAVFDVNYILGGYRTIITNLGSGYAINNVITITGDLIGGTKPKNNLELTVLAIDSNGGITSGIANGTPAGVVNQYYLKVISENQVGVYSNPNCNVPVSGQNFIYNGVVSTAATATDAPTDSITLTSSASFNINDPVVFTGNVFGNIVLGQTYYILTKPTSNTITISETIGGGTFPLATSSGSGMTMAKSGDYAFLPEPFFFNASIVKYNKQLYQCVVSNNDPEFIFGKWELLSSGSQKLNALDRIIGYYEPTVNMPGVDLTQLVNGITYPNSTYLGNPFAPADEFVVDTILTDKPFYPSGVNLKAIVWNGLNYLSGSDTTNNSAFNVSENGFDWTINNLANQTLNITDLIYAGGHYVITTNNNATPILISTNGYNWITNGTFTPFDSTSFGLTNFDVSSISVPATTLNSVTYNNGLYVAVGNDIVTSTDLYTWTMRYQFTNGLTNIFNGVTYVNTAGYTGFVAVGFGQQPVGGITTNYALIYTSTNAYAWNQVNFTATHLGFNSIAANSQTIVAVGDNGIIYTSFNATTWFAQSSGVATTLKNVVWDQHNNIFVAVGVNGVILTSTTYGTTWTIRSSGTTETLESIAFNSSGTQSLIVGSNNTVLHFNPATTTWTPSSNFISDPAAYTVEGDEFTAGYGPEELVPGVVTDTIMMTVATRPGTNWDETIYQHVGYNVVSTEIKPTSGNQKVYSFDNLVMTPAQLSVFIISYTNGLSTRIYEGVNYSVNWINNTITLTNSLNYLVPGTDTLKIDVYEVGNGDQLVKANTKTDPIRLNAVTGFQEIYVNANYNASVYQGSGLIRPGTNPIYVNAIATNSTNNTITCESVKDFVLNSPITFSGLVFGGIVEDQVYYVKSIGGYSDRITISATYNSSTGTAGETVVLTTATGIMEVVIRVGTGVVWTPPSMYHNGTTMVLGTTAPVVRTKASNNAITTISTGGLIVNQPIVFSETMFGGVIIPKQVYYVKSIYDGNEFTISQTVGGATLTLTDATGGAIFVTNDYAIGLADNGITASIILASNYDSSVDYITYTLMGETLPIQYGYTLPQTQQFTGDGSSASFSLTNYIGTTNANNAVVEVDGLRLNQSKYSINPNTNSILFTPPPSNGSSVAVTSYNLTERQYFNTQYNITGSKTLSTLTVSSTTNLVFGFDQDTPTVATFDQNTPSIVSFDEELNYLTTSSTSGLTIGYPIVFTNPTLGGLIAGQTYFVTAILNSTDFQISTQLGGSPVAVTSASGSMTGVINGLTVSNITTINNTISPPTATVTVTATTAVTNYITCNDTSVLISGQSIIFKAGIVNAGSFVIGKQYQITTVGSTNFTLIGASSNTVGVIFTATGAGTGTGQALFANAGGIDTTGQVYFVGTIVNPTKFTIVDQFNNVITLSTTTDVVVGYMGGNPAIRVTTGINNYFTQNELVRIDGVLGSTQLNNNTYYAHLITNTIFDLYTEPYNPALTAVNHPVTYASNYISGGYVWIDQLFTIADTNVISTTANGNRITVPSTTTLVAGTPVIFTEIGATLGQNLLGGILAKTTYYILQVRPEIAAGSFISGNTYEISIVGTSNWNTIGYVGTPVIGGTFTCNSSGQTGTGLAFGLQEFTISKERYPNEAEVLLTNATTPSGVTINVSQFEQVNVDRLWVTVNGYRVPSSALRLNAYNNLSISTVIQTGDEVIVTSMMPTATPNEEVYLLNVTTSNQPAVFRANTQTRTWLTKPLNYTDSVIYIDDVTRITDNVVQTVTCPAAVDGLYNIGLTSNKNVICHITVYNNTTSTTVDPANYQIIIVNSAPILEISAQVSAGNSLTITSVEGRLLYINGEQIGFEECDLVANTVSKLSRGANGTGVQKHIPMYSEVFGLIPNNRMSDVLYSAEWNSYVYNTIDGDPLQISVTDGANFLRTDRN